MLRNSDSQELLSRTSYLVTAWHEFLHVFLSAYSLNEQREREGLSEWRWPGREIEFIVDIPMSMIIIIGTISVNASIMDPPPKKK